MNLDNIPRNKKLELYFQFNEMIENTKNDLKKGISKEKLEVLHENNYFKSENDYFQIKNAIKNLEMIIDLYSPIVEQLKKELDKEN